VATIRNDDTPPSLTISGGSLPETDAGQTGGAFTVRLSAASSQTVTVNYATANGTATGGAACASGVDYIPATGTLSFAPGTTIHSVPVTICGDRDFEPDETLSMTLSSPSNASIGTATATLTVANDDVQPRAQAGTLSIADASVAEGNAGASNLSFTVTLAPASSGTVTVQYATANGTATAGACASGGDYQAASGTLTFTAGQTTQTIPVPICGDTAPEANETFTVTLANPSGATLGDGQATGTIQNDDAGGPGPSCAPRPNPTTTVSHVPGVGGRLQVTITAVSNGQAPGNTVQQVQFGAAKNALVEVPGQGPGRAGNFTLPVSAASTTFFLQRQAPGDFKVDLVIVDACNAVAGPFHTFVGGGAGVP
jgi:chitinase